MKEIWLIAFGLLWSVQFWLFGMQRATLLISRNAGIEWRGGGELLLPGWYPVTWIIIISKWALLLAMAILWTWKVALGLMVIGYILSISLPIQYSMYKGILKKRVDQIMQEDNELAQQLQDMLDSAPF